MAKSKRTPSTLEKWLAGIGVTSFAGSSQIQAMQKGFPAKLTGTFDPATGYPWEMLIIDPPDVTTVGSNPLTGGYAVTPDNNTALAADTRGWMEPDPGGQGFIFLTGGGGSPDSNCSSGLGWTKGFRGPSTVSATRCKTAGACDCGDGDFDIELSATTAGGPVFESATDLTISNCGTAYLLQWNLTDPGFPYFPRLFLIPEGSSGGSINLNGMIDSWGDGWVVYAFYDEDYLCTDTPNPCIDNVLKIKIERVPCGDVEFECGPEPYPTIPEILYLTFEDEITEETGTVVLVYTPGSPSPYLTPFLWTAGCLPTTGVFAGCDGFGLAVAFTCVDDEIFAAIYLTSGGADCQDTIEESGNIWVTNADGGVVTPGPIFVTNEDPVFLASSGSCLATPTAGFWTISETAP